jgi:DNA invertase Pin-like site-specific DNA recombinase
MSYTIAKYIRLSIEDAKNESLSIENQRLVLDSYISAMDEDDIEVVEFVDNGHSGTNFERPAVQGLLEHVRVGKVHCIVVKDFSRFGRNAVESGYFLQRVFPLFNTRFIALSDGYDSAEHIGDTGGLDISFRLLISERYSRDLSKKIKASKQEKARRGEAVFKNCIFGYKKVEDHLEIDEPAAKTIRLIFDLSASGKSLTDIAKRLHSDRCPTPSEYKNADDNPSCIWGNPGIHSILHNEQYIGTYTASKTKRVEVGSKKIIKVDESEWVKIPGHHPAIVDIEVFKAAHERMSNKHKPTKKREVGTAERYNKIDRPLKGKVICGCCNHKLKLSSTRNAVFQCQYTHSAPDAPCYRLKISCNELSAALLDTIRKHAQNDSGRVSRSMPLHNESEFTRLTDANKKKKQTLYEQFVRGEISATDFKSSKVLYDAELERLNGSHTANKVETGKVVAMRKTVTQLHELMESSEDENVLSRPIVELLIESVHVYPDGKVEVVWKSPGFETVIMAGASCT